MITKIAIGIIFTFFYSFVHAACDIREKDKLLPQCEPICVTIMDQLDTFNNFTRQEHITPITISVWNNNQHKASSETVIYTGTRVSLWVCPNQKITTSFYLNEKDLAKTPIIHETHCGIFTAQATSNSQDIIKIIGKLKNSFAAYTYFSKIYYPTFNINTLGVFKGSIIPAVCTPNNHPSDTESGDPL